MFAIIVYGYFSRKLILIFFSGNRNSCCVFHRLNESFSVRVLFVGYIFLTFLSYVINGCGTGTLVCYITLWSLPFSAIHLIPAFLTRVVEHLIFFKFILRNGGGLKCVMFWDSWRWERLANLNLYLSFTSQLYV